MHSTLRFILILVIGMLLVQCGEEGKEKHISVGMTPNEPIVYLNEAKRVIGVDDNNNPIFEDVSPNWMSFRLSIANGTDQIITVVNITISVKIRLNGEVKTASATFAPSEVDLPYWASLKVAKSTSVGAWTAATIDSDGTFLDSNPGLVPVTFYLQGLPKEDTQTNFRYEIKVELDGWFGTFDLPGGRLKKTEIFFSR